MKSLDPSKYTLTTVDWRKRIIISECTSIQHNPIALLLIPSQMTLNRLIWEI